jgi:hypothetical protein
MVLSKQKFGYGGSVLCFYHSIRSQLEFLDCLMGLILEVAWLTKLVSNLISFRGKHG